MKGTFALKLSTLFIALKVTLIKTDFKIDSFKTLKIIIHLPNNSWFYQQGKECFNFLGGKG